MGLTYTVFTQTVNYFAVPDLPLYSDGNILLKILIGTLTGAFLGFLVNTFSNGLAGVVIGSLLGTAAVIFEGLMKAANTSTEATALVALTLLYTFLPITVLFLPLTTLLRWAAGYYQHEGIVTTGGMFSRWRNMRVILGLIALAILFGSFAIIPEQGRMMLAKMNEYIVSAQTSGVENVPPNFRQVSDIAQNASSIFTLEWTDDLSKYPASLGSEDAPGQVTTLYNLVIARFESGEKIACIFRLNGAIFICSKIY